MRRAVEEAAEKLPAQQQEALHHYLAISAGAVRPQDVVDAALLLESLVRYTSLHPTMALLITNKVTSFCLSAHFTVRKPSAAKVARLITQEGWKVNCPKPEDIERLWTPPSKADVEDDKFILRCVSEQNWSGMAIKDFGDERGFGKKTFHLSCKGRKKQ